MKKKLIPSLIIAMALALSGLIAVQAYWLVEAAKMKSEAFERSVSQALRATNYTLEAREASRLLASRLDQKNLVKEIDALAGPALYTYDTIETAVLGKKPTPVALKPPAVQAVPTKPREAAVYQMKTDSMFLSNSTAFNFFFDNQHQALENWAAHVKDFGMFQPMQIFNLRIDVDSIISLIETQQDSFKISGTQEWVVLNPYKLAENSRHRARILNRQNNARTQSAAEKRNAAVQIAKEENQQIKRQIVRKKLSIDSLLSRVAFDMITPKLPIEARISPTEFDSILRFNLRQYGIESDYQFQVVREEADSLKVVFGMLKPASQYYEARLFPNDLFNLNERLMIQFPQQRWHTYTQLWSMLAVSLGLILVLFLVFFVTIHVLLKQKKISEMKSDFINNMTHEFKTPLATISLAADALANPKVMQNEGLINKYLGIIKTENKRMNVHVEQLLQTAQLERQELKLNFSSLLLPAILEHALDLMEMQLSDRGAQLSFDCQDKYILLMGDETHLTNVFTNLIDNALKYSQGTPIIAIKCKKLGQRIQIQISDRGIGMQRETRQHVFEKFYRLPTGNVHNVKGFGLGLSYVKAIVDAHQGQITVESEWGQGSTFTILLPLLKDSIHG